jgi:hypothetical protein
LSKRSLQGALLLCLAVAALLFSDPSRTQAAANSQGIRPVPSLQPVATQRLWLQVVRRHQVRTFAATPDCHPLRAVFYAPSDWLRLATKLAANASPCGEYYISIPPLAAAKTQFRTDQAWRIRALGMNFHALAEVHVPGWRAWITANNSSWYEAGVEVRRRMAAAGFDVSLGDGWIVNELSSGVRRGTASARTEMRDFVHGLHDGDGTLPVARGGVFGIGIGQGLLEPSVYKNQLENWFQDDSFWEDMSRYVSDWSQELYGDPRNYGVAGAALPTRRDYLIDYLRHQSVHARLGGAATAAARAFLDSADSPLANAAWQWDSGFGWTMIPVDLMKDYVSAQVYALRHFSAVNGEPADHWGFAWAPRNGTGMSAAEFASQTGEIIDRLAAAIHDSGEPLDPADPGAGACGPLGQNLWCGGEIPGAWFNDAWKTFTYWGQLALTFAAPTQALVAGRPSGPLALRTQLAGLAHSTPRAMSVALSSSSPGGMFSTSASGPWTSTLAVMVPAGGDRSPSVYYEDTFAGNPVLTATAAGTGSGSLTETVVAGPAAVARVAPSSVSLPALGSQAFAVMAADAYGNPVSVQSAHWSVVPEALGRVMPSSGGSTTFIAGSAGGSGSVTVVVGGVSASAKAVVVAAPTPPPPVECVVPRLRGKTLLAARHALRLRHCALGKVRRARSRTISRGRVLFQTPRPGAHRPRGSKVNVTISTGRRRTR